MITSASNERIRRIAAAQKKVRERNKEDIFLVEGIKMVLEAPERDRLEVYASEGFLEKSGSQLPEPLRRGLAEERDGFFRVSDRAYAAMSDTQSPQGILCVVRQKHYTLEDLLKGPESLIMVLENLQDPGNVGTILRAGEGAGVTGTLLTRNSADLYNPKVIRSTMGSIYRQPFVYTEDLHGDLKRLKEAGVHMYAAHLKGRRSYDLENFSGPTAFLIGNESRGLTDETAALADTYVRIPMLGSVESLNAAVASSVLMFEAARQRRRS